MQSQNGMLNFDKSKFDALLEREIRCKTHHHVKEVTKSRNEIFLDELFNSREFLFISGILAGIAVMIMTI